MLLILIGRRSRIVLSSFPYGKVLFISFTLSPYRARVGVVVIIFLSGKVRECSFRKSGFPPGIR